MLFMFERQERLALLFLIGVATVVIASHLILESLGKRPFASPFTDVSADGELVYVTGTIEHLTLTKNGGHLMMEVNNMSVFIPNQIATNFTVHKGENISIIGIVQTYRGKKEVIVQSATDIAPIP